MKSLKDHLFLSSLALMVIFALTFQACDSSSDDEHPEAIGFVIEQNGVEIVRYESNQFEWDPTGTWSDYYRDDVEGIVISPDVINLSGENPSGMTPSVTLRWIDHDGEIYNLPDLSEEEGGEFSLDWDWGKPNVLADECSDEARENPEDLDAIRPVNLEQHGSDGQWGFHFRADHSGSDQVRFHLMHDDHADFTSLWMDVYVPHDEHDLIDENGIYQHVRDKCRER